MISVITCSVKPDFLSSFSENLKSTIGIEYELIDFDNREKNWGLCKVYNTCAKKAKFDHLLFIHEDVIFHTLNWGCKLIAHLNNSDVGLVGIAGSKYKSKLPGPWWGVPKEMKKIHIIQSFQKNHAIINESIDDTIEVAVIDGVFMACRKEVWEEHKFDENTFKRFHNYDIDFSIDINKTHKVVCVNDILIEHLSNGSYNLDWLKSTIQISKKWKNILPLSTVQIDNDKSKMLEIGAYERYIELLTGRTNNPIRLIIHLLHYVLNGGNVKFAFIQALLWIKRR